MAAMAKDAYFNASIHRPPAWVVDAALCILKERLHDLSAVLLLLCRPKPFLAARLEAGRWRFQPWTLTAIRHLTQASGIGQRNPQALEAANVTKESMKITSRSQNGAMNHYLGGAKGN
ncbi:unnamed protein product [Clonostachys byssicola]|uniref:Uncharacterized protein n=1 Tax=Clonostachys byssicola TaxID=160290 RepID=A0A9N9UR32_9HYPO|nr:unnamed protein product [Clonostachys byssicola]